MNAIRRDEDLDNLHSIYVDQWDWEKVIAPQERTLQHLQETVERIVGAICDTEKTMRALFPALNILPATQRDITFITTQELEDQYPEWTPKEREDAFVKDHPTTFLMQIGGALRSGKPHDGRAPDYDDSFLWPGVMRAGHCPSTRRCSPGSCPILWAAVSASPACVCCCWAALTSAKCSPPSGMRRLGVSAQSAV